MSENEKTKAVGEVAFKASQHEDAALKTAMHFFAEELLPFWGIEGRVVGFAPTEQVHLEIQKLYQDTNLIMEDGSWKHFEFQSKNADIFLKELLEKKKTEKPITREELVRLTLCPLMGGEIGIKQRLQIACEITRGETAVTKEEIQKIEAVIYAMADKFLEGLDMEEFVEGMKMTRLGEMLVKEGEIKGKQEGMNEKETEIIKNLLGVLDDEVLMERLHISKERLEEVKDQK